MKKILIFTTSMGHGSIAEAGQAAFEKAGWQVKLVSFEFRETTLQYYPVYKLFPSLNKVGFELTKNGNFENLFRKIFKVRKLSDLEKVINNFQPDVVLSTYFLYNPPLETLKNTYNFRLLNYVCNPRTYHPLELSENVDLNLVYDQKAAERAKNLGVPADKVKALGWLVRPQFYEAEENRSDGKFTVTVCAGSLGAQGITKFLPVFTRLKKPVTLNLVAGSNKMLLNIFKSYRKMTRTFEDFLQSENEVNVYGFTDKIHELMACSDLVAGKAGPNLLFESVAVEKPFLALSHIPGQEDGNLEIIKEKNLGWVAEDPSEAQAKLEHILDKQLLVTKREEFLRNERWNNRKASIRLVDLANGLLKDKNKNSTLFENCSG